MPTRDTDRMARARLRPVDESATRTALLDAAEALMVENGYAAVTTRRVAATAGANSGLITYYFGTLENLFVELFRRRSERSLQRLGQVLDDPQPLWALWEQVSDPSSNAIVTEFIALANHRKGLKKEIASYSRKHRRLQIERLTQVLERHGADLERWPVASLLVLMAGTARFLTIEESFNVDIGHAETVAVIEREIRALEGERRKHRRQTSAAS
jgi:AcrR family transcriptional regulator